MPIVDRTHPRGGAVHAGWGSPRRCCHAPHTGRTFVTQLIRLAAGRGRRIASGSSGVRPTPRCGARLPAPFRPSPYVDNPSHELGQLSSLLAGARVRGGARRGWRARRAGGHAADQGRHRARGAGRLRCAGPAGAAGHASRAARSSGDLRRRCCSPCFAAPIPRWALARSSVKTRLGSAIWRSTIPGVLRDIDLPGRVPPAVRLARDRTRGHGLGSDLPSIADGG